MPRRTKPKAPVNHMREAPVQPADLSRGYLPVLIVVALLAGACALAFTAGSTVSRYTADQDAVQARLRGVEVTLAEIQKSISSLHEQGRDGIRRADFESWCKKAEGENKSWRCPPFMR